MPNPFITHIYTADPSAHVWEDGRLYVYPSQDIYPPRGCDLMDHYHVFSTDDMVNWHDHGVILSSKDVEWGRPEGGFMWAPDCAYKNGTYYFYFPHPSGSDWDATWKIGVATSDKPASDFKSQGYIPGLGGYSMIDPAVFIDDDGQPYMAYGGKGCCHIGKMKENMMEIDGQMADVSDQLEDYHEGPWLFKREGIYYLMYADNHSEIETDAEGNERRRNANQLRYATASDPMGPYTSQGVILDPTNSGTSHGSIVQYKGQWYLFYHYMHNTAEKGALRAICFDKLFFNPDGSIQKVIQTR